MRSAAPKGQQVEVADLPIVIPARDRHWVADALYEAITRREAESARMGRGMGKILGGVADRLRVLADEIVP